MSPRDPGKAGPSRVGSKSAQVLAGFAAAAEVVFFAGPGSAAARRPDDLRGRRPQAALKLRRRG